MVSGAYKNAIELATPQLTSPSQGLYACTNAPQARGTKISPGISAETHNTKP